jgi:preprotein translocase subunit SecD
MLKHLLSASILLLMLLACSESEKVSLEFRIAEDKPGSDLTETVFEPTGETFYLHNEVLLNQYDVESAAVVTQQGRPAVELFLTTEGIKKFKELTAQNVGKRCGMVLNGKLLSAPIIKDTISGDRAIITGYLTEAEAESIAKGLSQH